MMTFISALRRLAKGLAVLAFVGGTTFALAQPEPTLNEVYAAAQAGKLADAQVMMQQVLISHPNSAKAHYVRSELFARQGDLPRAREALATAAKLAPGLPFANSDSVQALRAQLSTGSEVPSAAAYPTSPLSPVSWVTPLFLTVVVIAVGYFAFRRRAPQELLPRASGRFGYAASQGSQGMPQPYAMGSANAQARYPQQAGSGLGGRIAGGLATGLAVGAGMMAAEAIGRSLGAGHGRDHPTNDSFANGQGNDFLRRNADMGGQNFGVDDTASWDDAGMDAGSNDWDS